MLEISQIQRIIFEDYKIPLGNFKKSQCDFRYNFTVFTYRDRCNLKFLFSINFSSVSICTLGSIGNVLGSYLFVSSSALRGPICI